MTAANKMHETSRKQQNHDECTNQTTKYSVDDAILCVNCTTRIIESSFSTRTRHEKCPRERRGTRIKREKKSKEFFRVFSCCESVKTENARRQSISSVCRVMGVRTNWHSNIRLYVIDGNNVKLHIKDEWRINDWKRVNWPSFILLLHSSYLPLFSSCSLRLWFCAWLRLWQLSTHANLTNTRALNRAWEQRSSEK